MNYLMKCAAALAALIAGSPAYAEAPHRILDGFYSGQGTQIVNDADWTPVCTFSGNFADFGGADENYTLRLVMPYDYKNQTGSSRFHEFSLTIDPDNAAETTIWQSAGPGLSSSSALKQGNFEVVFTTSPVWVRGELTLTTPGIVGSLTYAFGSAFQNGFVATSFTTTLYMRNSIANNNLWFQPTDCVWYAE